MKTKTRRSGASLIEVVVVMAIVIIVAALAVPSIRGMYGSYKLNGAVDSVRSAWADARARAIEEGRPYRFAVEAEGSSFRVAPDHPDYWNGTDSAPQDDPNGAGLVLEKSLPGGVRFTVNGEGTADVANDASADSFEEKPVNAGANWSPAVIFLPDGTAREDVKVEFRVRGCKPASLQLRGLTGNASVQDH